MTLIDPNFNNCSPFTSGYTKLGTGLYQISHFNMDMLISFHGSNLRDSDDWEGYFDLNSLIQLPEKLLTDLDDEYGYHENCAYGVCDSPEQFMELLGDGLNSSKEEFCVSFTCIEKKNEVPGNWRWCKWGPYIGKGKPQFEYLYDEPDFTKVYCYHVFHKTF